MFAKIKNNTLAEWPIINLYLRFPNTSFPEPISDQSLPEGIVRLHTGDIPQYNPAMQHLVLQDPALIEGRWVREYTAVAFSELELSQQNTVKAAQVREQRDEKLAQSDWTQVADSPVDKRAWLVYRQTLRDITKQVDFPSNVIWPAPPQ